MAETSGFFDAVYDESTQEYDLEYLSSQFASYFALFIGNGVFGSPTNQLKVRPSEGLKVTVSKGWAFINGYWYYNDSDKELIIPTNVSSQTRTDSVRCRYDAASRSITAIYFNGDTSVVRNDSYFDLKLAEFIIPAAATQVLESNITDTRMNETVCGFVTGLLEVQTTEDLFAQYQAIFDEWFDSIKGKLGTDVAGNLQLQVDELNDRTEFPNGETFYVDFKDGKYGFNTDPNRGADTFVPFRKGVDVSNIPILQFYFSDVQGNIYINIKNRILNWEDLSIDNFFFKWFGSIKPYESIQIIKYVEGIVTVWVDYPLATGSDVNIGLAIVGGVEI